MDRRALPRRDRRAQSNARRTRTHTRPGLFPSRGLKRWLRGEGKGVRKTGKRERSNAETIRLWLLAVAAVTSALAALLTVLLR